MYTTCQLGVYILCMTINLLVLSFIVTLNFPLYDITSLYDIPSYKLLQYKYLTKGQKVMAVKLTTIQTKSHYALSLI